MEHISQRIQAMSPSATLAMSQKSTELKAQGVDVINLSVGEPDFETPVHISKESNRRWLYTLHTGSRLHVASQSRSCQT